MDLSWNANPECMGYREATARSRPELTVHDVYSGPTGVTLVPLACSKVEQTPRMCVTCLSPWKKKNVDPSFHRNEKKQNIDFAQKKINPTTASHLWNVDRAPISVR